MKSDTICALSSGGGRSGVAVIRISGSGAVAALARLSGAETPPPRRATRVDLRDPSHGAELDRGLAIVFPGPASFTGEDVVELHIHGGRATIRAVLDTLTGPLKLRPAEPGEFTRRAFENQKLDLTAAEGLADLIDAETEAQRRQALRQLEGHLATLYDGWREVLTRLLAYLEAHIDFPDEDLPPGLIEGQRAKISALRDGIAGHLSDNRRGERLRDGLHIAILGPPNVGKSSLLNAIAQRDAAIVAESAGTTRDIIEVHIDLGGYPLTLADTAGVRETEDAVEKEGVRRSIHRAGDADLRIVMADATTWPCDDPAIFELVQGATLVVVNKIDLARPDGPLKVAGQTALPLSVATGDGMPALLSALQERAAQMLGGSESPALTRSRHRHALEGCVSALDRAVAANTPETIAEDLRLAVRELGRITGRVGVEDILDVVFRDFCIGK